MTVDVFLVYSELLVLRGTALFFFFFFKPSICILFENCLNENSVFLIKMLGYENKAEEKISLDTDVCLNPTDL